MPTLARDIAGAPVRIGRATALLDRPAAPLLVALVALAGFANALANGFVLDDRIVVLANPLVRSLDGIWKAFAHAYWPTGEGQYRPLVIASFAIDWAISGGDPRWFHLVNLLWHAAASVAVWVLARHLMRPAAALLAGVIFAIHPVHVEAVANTVGRAESMAALFALLALLHHRRGSLRAPLLYALALTAKESAAVFLPLALLHDSLLAGDARATLRERRRLYMWYAIVAAAYGAALWLVFHDEPMVDIAAFWERATAGERILTAISVVPHYVRLLVWPMDLAPDYSARIVELARTITPGVVLGTVILVAAAALCVHTWRQRPLVAFGIAWFAIAVAPVANVFFASGVVLAERTLYLPSVGAVLLAGWLLERALHARPALAIVASALLLSAFAVRTWTRTDDWRDSRTLLLEWLEDHPESYRAHAFAGQVLEAGGRRAAAAEEYRRARYLFTGDPGLYLMSAANLTHLSDLRAARALLDSAVALESDLPQAHLGLADIHFRLGDFARAAASARQAFELEPDSMRAAYVHGLALHRLGVLDQSRGAYLAGIVRHPEAWELRQGMAEVLLAAGDTAAAQREIATAMALHRASSDSP